MPEDFALINRSNRLVDHAEKVVAPDHYAVDLTLAKEVKVRRATAGSVWVRARWVSTRGPRPPTDRCLLIGGRPIAPGLVESGQLCT